MLVIHYAARLIEHLPAPLPRHISNIGVFQIEWREQLVESAQLQKLFAIERAGSAATIGAWIGNLNRGIVAMPYPQRAILPPRLRKPGLLAQLIRIAEVDLARYREHRFIGERLEQRLKEIALHAHVAIQQHDDVVLRRAKPRI